MEIFDEALNLLNSGNFSQVISLISNFLDENPQYKTIDYYHFSNPIEEILFDVYIGKIEEVKILDLGENLDEIYHVYSIAFGGIGDIENAEKYLKIANQINPVSCPVLMRLCEHYQAKNEENKIRDFALDIMKYTYERELLISSYFKLADYYYHTNQEMELYEHLLSFYIHVRTWENMEDVSEDMKYLEEHDVQVGFNPEVLQILIYLIDVHTKQGLESTVAYFKNIFGEMIEFTNSLNELR